MPNPVVAIAGAAVASAVSGEGASSRARSSARDALGFETQKYNDWKAVYGPIEDNLSEYYASLTPDRLIAQGLQNQQIEFQKAEVSIRENIARRGLEGSGVEATAETGLAIQKALAKARVRSDAPEEIARQKQSFLQGGEARRAGAERGIANQLQDRVSGQRAEAAGKFEAAGSLLNLGLANMGGGATPTASTPTVLRA